MTLSHHRICSPADGGSVTKLDASLIT